MEMKQREVVFIGDRSYSMLALGDAPWKGARNWANGQAKVAKENRTRAFITLVSFDDQIERPLDSVPAGPDSDWKDLSDEVVKEWMKPRGATALYDAFVGEVHALIEKKKNRGEECSAALALFTDGHDTSSTKKLPISGTWTTLFRITRYTSPIAADTQSLSIRWRLKLPE